MDGKELPALARSDRYNETSRSARAKTIIINPKGSTMVSMIATKQQTLTKADRCDATCPAGAMVRVTTKDLGTFLFCGHHFDMNKDVLPDIVHVHDERNPIDRLIEASEPTVAEDKEAE